MTPWTVAHQTALYLDFCRQEYRSGLPFPSPVDLLNPGIKLVSFALSGGFFTAEPSGKPKEVPCCSVTQSCPTLRPYGLQHARFLCLSLTPSVCSNSCTLSQWCQPTISSSVDPFFSCPQSFPASELFPMVSCLIRWPKYLSFSLSISPSSEYSELISFRIDCFDLLVIQGALKSLLLHHSLKASIFLGSANSHICTWLLEKPWFWLYRLLSAKWCLCFLMCCVLSRFVIYFLPTSKHLLISWLQSPSAVILESPPPHTHTQRAF